MGGRKDNSDADRFLLTKRGTYYYQRKVPLGLRGLRARADCPHIPKDKRIAEARVRRDAYEEAGNQLWGAMTAGDDQQRAIRNYQAAVKRAEALGFSYRSSIDLAEGPLDELLQRAEALEVGAISPERASALLGGEAPPQLSMTDVGTLYIEEIATDELRTKSDQQRRKWRTVKSRAVTSYCFKAEIVDLWVTNSLENRPSQIAGICPGRASEMLTFVSLACVVEDNPQGVSAT